MELSTKTVLLPSFRLSTTFSPSKQEHIKRNTPFSVLRCALVYPLNAAMSTALDNGKKEGSFAFVLRSSSVVGQKGSGGGGWNIGIFVNKPCSITPLWRNHRWLPWQP